MTIPSKPMLKAESLHKTFKVGSRFRAGGIQHLHALSDVSLEVYPGEIVGLVGESGCGKSTLGRCLLRLYDVDDGRITFKDRDITGLSQRELRPLRADMQMVFQDPYSSLNPRRRVGDLIAEPLRVHGKHSASDVQARLRELMELVNLSPDFLTRFPHEFSGGQRQRIGIARAIALSPSLIVADEPVSALDVSVQAQIVNLFMDLQEKLGLTYVFIAHDLSVVRQIATRTAVMYLGGIVELGETDRVLHRPAHPYTAALISAVPEPDPQGNIKARTILRGEPPSPTNPPSGCRFHTRCPVAEARCSAEVPLLRALGDNRSVACHFPLDGSAAAHA
ncbi:ABC transporter ATP-binding protein [Acidisoma silvae]|uniref:ABC transporter ATP-binding protein n=1 Tax=Acidisoma silvae TaxID=2802396 RepID=A0A963YMU6_9PROT|nr:ABC transporter ATP-binding protein [Acidisoma silvae]MCB8873761.1 ABC transporter ATP-binding protein [Acidisoma silvae]